MQAAQIEKKIDTWASQLVGAGIEEFETLSREMDAPLVCVWAHPSHAGGLPEIDDAVRASSTVVVLASASVNGYRGRRSMTRARRAVRLRPDRHLEPSWSSRERRRVKNEIKDEDGRVYLRLCLCLYLYKKRWFVVRVVRIHPPLTRSGRC